MNPLRMMVALIALILVAAPARAADSCIDCHRKAVLPLDREHDYAQWEQSAHGKAGVSCHSCHGGDPTQSGPNAHKGLLPSSDPASPIYFTKVPETCGACHTEELQAFRKSAHHKELMRSGKGPNCVTCHGSMANEILSPKHLENTCSLCHRKPMGARPALMALNNASAAVERLGTQIGRSGDAAEAKETFARLEKERGELLRDWHTFTLKGVLEKSQALTKKAIAAARALSAHDANKAK
ncbi:MAG: hypothetical protein HY923_10375 [Elusimicrobia bacterium]|nr:hypothetical protein [Elusimicrobiota bacterium]